MLAPADREASAETLLAEMETHHIDQAMLERAIPWASTCGEQEQMAGEFLALCQQNYVRALTSLMSSVAIAKRN